MVERRKNMNKISEKIHYVGVNDLKIDLFEGQYKVPNGMSYNSYILLDDKITIMDTVDQHFSNEWLANIRKEIGDKKPSYLVVQHMEPDHSGSIANFLKVYPDTTVVGNDKTFRMIDQFFHCEIKNKLVVKDNDSLSIGQHKLTFVFAPMVHWAVFMFNYVYSEKVLFSGVAFGKFGSLGTHDNWVDEARRYYIGIVGKYGPQVQNVLNKAKQIDIATIAPLHGPILNSDLGKYLNLYDLWSSYKPEEEGVVICYTSVYGNTKKAVMLLKEELTKNNKKVVVHDLAREDLSVCLADAFRYSKLVLATTTYNANLYPFMNFFLEILVEHNFQNRSVSLIENGSWYPTAANLMKKKLENSKNLTYIEPSIKILSSLTDENINQIKELAKNL